MPQLRPEHIELLETVGYYDIRSLAKANANSLEAEIHKADKVLKFSHEIPSAQEIESWITIAQQIEGGDSDDVPVDEPALQNQNSGNASAVTGTKRVAIPLPAAVILEQGIQTSQIPVAKDIVHHESDTPTSHLPMAESTRRIQIAGSGEVETKLGINHERIKPLSEAPVVSRNPAMDRPKTKEEERVALIRTPREKTNRGKNPNSRRYIRGVLHTHPLQIWLGALSTLLVMLTLPFAVVAATFLVLSREQEEIFGWVPSWFLVFPLLLLVAALFYLVLGMHGSCRICGQKLFMHRQHRKNAKAHRIPGLGYVIPLCLHILLFRWFRCTHCGTPVRLKE